MSEYVGWRKVQDFLLAGGATYGAIWLVIEPLSAFLPTLKPEGFGWYALFLALSAIGGIWRVSPTKRIEVQIPGSDSLFEIQFGDVFDGDGVVVIPVNEYFDGELGDHVSRHSLHGQFIWNVLGGHSKTFFDLTGGALAEVDTEEVGVARSSGQRDRYAIGTVARVDIKGRCFLLAALSHTDLASLKANATVQDLWVCLAGVWSAVRQYSGGEPVRIPLIGSGLSGIGLLPVNLLEITMISFLYHTKEQRVTDRVTLVLPRRLAGKLDLTSIKRSWT